MDLIPRRRRADLIRPQQWQGRKRPRELTFSWLQLIIRCVFSFFPAGGREKFSRGGERKIGGRERERQRSSAKGSTDDYSRQRGRGLLQRWVGGAAELKRNVGRGTGRDKPQAATSPRFPPSNLTYGPPTPHGWKF